ncbi:MAG: low molecular weight phosphatase family protein [Notoacmeibacter sp.]|nr:low molecular weight phosphatase family protein [Notoacmeibacter sp.]
MPDTPGSILFVCGMNAIRSPMAEQLARAILPQGVYIVSAGVHEGERDPFVDAVLAEKGLTLGQRLPQLLEDIEDNYFDLIVTLSPEAHHKALDMTRTHAGELEFWPTADPSDTRGTREQILEAYRSVRDHLEQRIREKLSKGSGSAQ